MSQECDVSLGEHFRQSAAVPAGEDLTRYPRTLDDDLNLCAAAGVHLVFAPPVEEVYPSSFATRVSVSGLTAVGAANSARAILMGYTDSRGQSCSACVHRTRALTLA